MDYLRHAYVVDLRMLVQDIFGGDHIEGQTLGHIFDQRSVAQQLFLIDRVLNRSEHERVNVKHFK